MTYGSCCSVTVHAAGRRSLFVPVGLVSARAVSVGVQAGGDERWEEGGAGLRLAGPLFPSGAADQGPEHETFRIVWVMRTGSEVWRIEVRTGIWNQCRCREGVSRLSQASGRLVQLTGSEVAAPVGFGVGVLSPSCYRDPQLSEPTGRDWVGDLPVGITLTGRQCPERGTPARRFSARDDLQALTCTATMRDAACRTRKRTSPSACASPRFTGPIRGVPPNRVIPRTGHTEDRRPKTTGRRPQAEVEGRRSKDDDRRHGDGEEVSRPWRT